MSGTMYSNVFTFMLQRDNTTLENNNQNTPPPENSSDESLNLDQLFDDNSKATVKSL